MLVGTHIELDYHFIRERVAMGLLTTRHVSSTLQLANFFTKPLCKATLLRIRSKLYLHPRHTLREGNNNQLLESNWSDKDRRDRDDRSNKEVDQVIVAIPKTMDHENNLRGCIETQSCIKGKSTKEHSAPSFKEVIAHK